ncbi:MAG: hypothetical protein HYR63_06755 [Proteobacteria bacterium]|nr:hypothetical protein [Pseudomonadota bacterium]
MTDTAWPQDRIGDPARNGDASPPIRLPDAFTVNFGDASVLSEFCLRADRVFEAAGIDLYLTRDLIELKRVNEMNLDSWFPLFPVFDVAYGGANPDNSYFIYGIDRANGEIVATVAGRTYLMSSLSEKVRSLELYYPDPAAQAAAGEWSCYSGEAAAAADLIKGRVVMSGAGWFKPNSARGRGFAKILPRLSRAYARATWGTDFTVSMVKRPHIELGIARAYGYTRVAQTWHWSSPWAEESHIFEAPVDLVWMPAEELEADLGARNRADASSQHVRISLSAAAD